MRRPLTACGGAGLGLRRPLLQALLDASGPAPDFLEIAPENWIGVGGRLGRALCQAAERWPIWLHGLSLDLGGPRPLDTVLLDRIRTLRRRLAGPGWQPPYSEHLSWCADDGHLYDLLPLPFTFETARYVARRIREVQDRLGERIAVENSTYYAVPGGASLSEAEFIAAVAEEADCELLVDVNNVYVNSINHGYDPLAFLRALPASRVRYLHVAGHRQETDAGGRPLLIDTHGSAVITAVWQLLTEALRLYGPLPVLLERDFNFPPVAELLDELVMIRTALSAHGGGR